MAIMRTTLTLDPDVAAMLKKEMRQQKATLKETINKALRAGLQAAPDPAPTSQPYRMGTLNLGRPLINLDRTSEVLAMLDDLDFAETGKLK
jgi:hypothetical protein